ncbi:MAG: transglycosylase SLT domain-containing protein [Rhodanobacteraceae bacterium]
MLTLKSRLVRLTLLASVLVLPVQAACAAEQPGEKTDAPADQHSQQRIQFAAAYAAARLGGDSWRLLASGLADYPLYPYLQAASMEHDIGTVSSDDVEAYLKRYPDLIPAHDLRRDFLHQLAGRKDWTGFRKLYRPGLGYALACDELQARLAAGQTLNFSADLASIWKNTALPSACDPVLEWAHRRGLLTKERLWQRVERAIEHGHTGTVTAMSRWLPRGDGIVARRLVLARKNPRKALREADTWHDSLHTRMAVKLALKRLAIADDEAAGKAWHKLHKRFDFSADQRHAIEASIALFNATDFEPDSLSKLNRLPDAAQTDSTRAWRVRVALTTGDWKRALKALDELTPEQQRDTPWRYWRARTLAQLGQRDKARDLFAQLATEANYYGFLAADWLDQPYAICPLQLAGGSASEDELLKKPGLRRAFELHALDMLPMARREWNWAMRDLDSDQRRLAADLATRRGWYDRAIFSFSSGRDLHLYRQRFPLARKSRLLASAGRNGLDPAWAYAIIRAESAWVTDARSGANAYGLMQLLPSTGAHAARKLDQPWHGSSSLFDADTNISLGTYYLAEMAARYRGSPWLASAAYNAGANKVDEWLDARRQLPPDVFIDTMPYHETRAYVRRVLAFSVLYDWRLHQRALPLAARMPRVGQSYAAPDADAQRKPVVCPAPHAAAIQTPSDTRVAG